MGVIKDHSKTIDGITYTTKTLPASVGLVIMPQLIALLGDKLMSLVFGMLEEGGTDALQDLLDHPRVLGPVIADIAKTISDSSAKEPTKVFREVLIRTIADKVDIGAERPVEGNVHEWFDEHFGANYGHMMKVVWWVSSVNFTGPSLGSLSPSGGDSEPKVSAA